MNIVHLQHYLSFIENFIEQKKIRFIVGKQDTGIQITISQAEAREHDVKFDVVQNLLPILFQVASLGVTNERGPAIELIQSTEIFSGVPAEVVYSLISKHICTDSFKRNYLHRVVAFVPVLDSMEASYFIKPTKKPEAFPDIPSVHLSIRTRGASRPDENFETTMELSVDDIESFYGLFKALRKSLREKTAGTIFYIQEKD